jgi:hypothetical protein
MLIMLESRSSDCHYSDKGTPNSQHKPLSVVILENRYASSTQTFPITTRRRQQSGKKAGRILAA